MKQMKKNLKHLIQIKCRKIQFLISIDVDYQIDFEPQLIRII